jgi:WD40 repeat protein
MYFVGVEEDRIDIWDYHSSQHVATLSSEGGFNQYLYNFSGDGSMLAVGHSNCQEVIMWEVSSVDECKEVYRLTAPSFVNRPHTYSVLFMKHDEQLLVEYGSVFVLYDVRSGSRLHMVDSINARTLFIQGTPGGIIILSGNGLLREWDGTLTQIQQRNLGFEMVCADIAYLEDTVVVATKDSIAVVDLATLTSRKMFPEVVSLIESLQLSGDGSKILVNMCDSSRRLLLDVSNETVLLEFDSYINACFGYGAKHIFGSSLHGGVFCLDAETGSTISCPFSRPELPISKGYDSLIVFPYAEIILM